MRNCFLALIVCLRSRYWRFMKYDGMLLKLLQSHLSSSQKIYFVKLGGIFGHGGRSVARGIRYA